MLIANGASGECRIADPSRLSSLMMLTQQIGRLGTCKGEDHNNTRLVVLIEVRSGRTLGGLHKSIRRTQSQLAASFETRTNDSNNEYMLGRVYDTRKRTCR
jgi:hypothetical protein